ncbi:hypothetical protein B9Z55_000054 [Caenorhabditis nigoni]|uniref:Protein AATF n=1 Tax=Caenorhabditis nigoni TaxID=1611254 RepID=A0A2G5VTN0_9PELO|nr:hypothetical protein B9Z55_000054 [Caenorhabditis nigoni]
MGLLDDISKLTQPAAELPDVEDDFDASSLVKPTGKRSKNKLQNFNFEEGKYAGVAVSSKDIFGDVSEISGLKAKDSDSEDDVDDEEAEDEEDVEEESDVEMEEDVGEKKKKKSNILENLADSDEDEEMDDEEDDEEEEKGDSVDDQEEEEAEDDGEEENLKMTTLSLRDDSDKAEKATSVLHQRQVWDDLSYSNIRIHALLNAMNQMPRGDARREFMKNCDPSTQKSMEAAMENMAKLRDLMAKAGGFFEEKSGKTEDSDDEEIPSDDEEILSDSEGLDDEEEEEGEEEDAPKKKAENQGKSLKSLKKNLEALDGSIDKFRAATLTKWYNRTKVLSSKSMNNADFSVFEKGSILGQINKVLADEDKLLKKVHTNRSGKTRLGSAPSDSAHDPEIFDDSDFYQVLLKQMLEARNQMNQNSQDGADMTRNYMELQSMISNKKKRDVSQLSSKDRKLKYEPIAKLINFYPSKPSVATWSHESRNELFKSLFS